MFEVGQVIAGKYRIDRELGQGGMGSVVAATHLQLGTSVAIKYLKDAQRQQELLVARFLREARAAAQMRSEHICRVLDVAEEGGHPYIVMELLEGSDLSKVAKAGPVAIGDAVEYVRQACAGLAEAHARKIVHRDLKPANLFLTERADGSMLVKVLDFGVAKTDTSAVYSGPRLTESLHIVGSPAYMSPEQINSSRDVDSRTDVWSLGVILYRLLAGRTPFDGQNMAQLVMQIVESPTPPLPAHVPAGLAAVIEKCLDKDPDARIQTVTELSQALRPFAGVAAIRETDLVPLPGGSRTDDADTTVNHRGPLPASEGMITKQLTPSPPSSRPPVVHTLRMPPVAKAPSSPAAPLISEQVTAQLPAATALPVTSVETVSTKGRTWIPAVAAVAAAALALAIVGWQIAGGRNETSAAPSTSTSAPPIAPTGATAPAAPDPAAAATVPTPPTRAEPAVEPAPVATAEPAPVAAAEPDQGKTTKATRVKTTHTAKTTTKTDATAATKTEPKTDARSSTKTDAKTDAKTTTDTKPMTTKPAETKPTDFGASRI